MWKILDTKSADEFRQWARETYVPGEEINPTWHPVVREECHTMNAEAAEAHKWVKEDQA